MSKYNAFRRKLDISENCIANYESSFITDGTSAVKIYSLRLNSYKQAAIIITDKEGPDTSFVYTFKERVKEQELLKGDYYTWNNNTYFVYEDVPIVLEGKYKKQRSYQCNVIVNNDDNYCGGYFVSSLAKYMDTTLQSNLNIADNDKPILILPNCDWVKNGTQVVIQNKPYKIIAVDNITNNGIAYCSLDRDFLDKFDDAVPELENALIAGIEQELSVENGAFETNYKVEIVSKTIDSVKFIIPYGLNEITINGIIYKVVV